MTTRYPQLVDLQALVGQVLGVSDWHTVDQNCIDDFAAATGDSQWIHTDPTRAQAGPYGTTIAHGLLTLSLLPRMAASAFRVDSIRMSINYGLNRVRFPAVLPSGSRVRGHFKLLEFVRRPRRPAGDRNERGARASHEARLRCGVSLATLCVAELTAAEVGRGIADLWVVGRNSAHNFRLICEIRRIGCEPKPLRFSAICR